MPSKRQPSKQRRATENRARREALAARSQHAAQPRVTPRASSPSVTSSGGGRGAASRRVAPPASGWRGWLGVGPGRAPGALAAAAAVGFAFLSFFAMPFTPVDVDDRGDQIPVTWSGLYLGARSELTGQEVTAESTTLIDAGGPAVLAIAGVPLLLVIGVFVYFRRTGRSLPLTVGMLALAVMVMIIGVIYFLPSMIALAVGSFQVRRIEMAERMAEQRAAAADDEEPDDALDEDDEFDEDDEDYEDDVTDEDYDDEDYDDELEDDVYDEDEEPVEVADEDEGQVIQDEEDQGDAEVVAEEDAPRPRPKKR